MKKCFLLSIICLMTASYVLAQNNPNVFKHNVGAIEVYLLSEGPETGNSRVLVGATPEMIEECLTDGNFSNPINAFLVRFPSGKNVLVDTGRRSQPLLENLGSIGVTADQIDVVLITHTHGDHIGGTIVDGSAVFPRAELYMSKQEHDLNSSGAGARNMIEAYGSRLRLFEPKEIDASPDELFAGIRAVAAFGHTPGHTLFLVESGAEKLLIWGDLTHANDIQMQYPQVALIWDTDNEKAIETRKKVFEYIVANNLTVAGMHNAFPGMGKMTNRAGGGYTYTPVNN